MKKPWYKRWWVWAIALLVLIMAVSGGDETEKAQNNQGADEAEQNEVTEDNAETEEPEEAEEPAEEPEEPVEETPEQKMIGKIMELIDAGQAFDTGSYIQGDIPKGEYAFVSFEGSGKYYVEKDSSGNIIDNENFDSFGYVYVHNAGNLQTKGVLVSVDAFDELGVSGAKEIYEVLNGVENYKDAGYYKVGLDISPGKYVIESYGEGYVAVMAGPIGKSDIVDNENFNGRYSVNVSEGQYLKISRGTIAE